MCWGKGDGNETQGCANDGYGMVGSPTPVQQAPLLERSSTRGEAADPEGKAMNSIDERLADALRAWHPLACSPNYCPCIGAK